jgi:predicted anti-sigma-YlaC factor YlaD
MICSDCIEQLLDYNTRTADERSIIDQHLAGCESCRDYRTALSTVDVWLDHEFPSVQVSPEFADSVRSRIRILDSAARKRFLLPAILDFVGYFSLAVALAVTMILLFPKLPSDMRKLAMRSDALPYAECLMFVVAVGFAIKVYADIRLDSKS